MSTLSLLWPLYTDPINLGHTWRLRYGDRPGRPGSWRRWAPLCRASAWSHCPPALVCGSDSVCVWLRGCSSWGPRAGTKVPMAGSDAEQQRAWVLVCEVLTPGTANGHLLACLQMKCVPSGGRAVSAGSQLQRKRRVLLTWKADASLSP